MSNRKLDTIEWVESHNGVDFNCKLQIAKHPGDEKNIFLIIPGVDGSLDGYEEKYLKIAESVNIQHGLTSYQIDNPYISRLHWESNVRQILDHIFMEHPEIESINIMAHSAGAWVIGNIAHEYPEIKRVLMVNPASNVDLDKLRSNIEKNKSATFTLLIGSNDPSHEHHDKFEMDNSLVVLVEGADHHFSGDAFAHFLQSPHKYLF